MGDMLFKIQRKDQIDIKIKDPIFIVGCGHSGNSLMLAILGSHKDIYPVPHETNLFYKDRNGIRTQINLIEEECVKSGKKTYVEKTPKHVYKIDEIFQHFPDSRIIFMLRDGRDVACSLKARQKDFSSGVERWLNDNIEARKHLGNDNILLVKYEDVVKNTNETLLRVFDFINKGYSPEILDFHKRKREWFGASSHEKPSSIDSIEDHKNLRSWQVNQPIFDGSGRWKSEMTAAEKEEFKQKGQVYLELFGYEKNANW